MLLIYVVCKSVLLSALTNMLRLLFHCIQGQVYKNILLMFKYIVDIILMHEYARKLNVSASAKLSNA